MAKKTELMNLRDYAKIFPKSMVKSNRGSKEGEGVNRQSILYRVTKGIELPYVTKVELIGRQYILHVQKP